MIPINLENYTHRSEVNYAYLETIHITVAGLDNFSDVWYQRLVADAHPLLVDNLNDRPRTNHTGLANTVSPNFDEKSKCPPSQILCIVTLTNIGKQAELC